MLFGRIILAGLVMGLASCAGNKGGASSTLDPVLAIVPATMAGLDSAALDSLASWQQYKLGMSAADRGDWLEAQYYFDLALLELGTEVSDTANVRHSQYTREMPLRLALALEALYPRISLLANPDSSYGLYEDIGVPEEEEEDGYALDSNDIREIRSFLDTLDPKQFSFPMVLNERVLAELHYFTHRARTFVEGSLSRKTAYEDMIRAKIKDRGMPEDLIYLSLVESGFKGRAYSKAKAAGLWQFIPGTGKRYGLRIDFWVDERRDAEKATEAALDYLSALHGEFGDWLLAMAAYNCGEGRVRRLVREAAANPDTLMRATDYWSLNLPRETMHYVPRILAATIIGHYPHHYGFVVQKEERIPVDTISVADPLPLQTIAEAVGSSSETIRDLNIELNRWSTPADGKAFKLKLPLGTRDRFAEAYERMDKSKLSRFQWHKVRSGENLGVIARKYGISVSMLQQANSMKNTRLAVGQSLMIPFGHGTEVSKSLRAEAASSNANEDNQAQKVRPITGSSLKYKVVKGDNLFEISRRFGVSMEDVKAWNKLGSSGAVQVGQVLRIQAPSQSGLEKETKVGASAEPIPATGKDYKVKEGDNLYALSRRFGVPMQNLLTWNKLESGSQIQVGQRILIRAPAQSSTASKADKSDNKLTSNATGSGRWYVVRSGDSLWDIARRNGVSVQEIQKWNDLSDTKVKVGTRLRVGE